VVLQRTIIKIGKLVTSNHCELLKKIPGLGTFCTQSLILRLNKVVLFVFPY